MGFANMKVTGLGTVRSRLIRLPKALTLALKGALRDEGDELLTDSKENYVPRMDSHLYNSGVVVGPKGVGVNMFVDIGFGGSAAPYALTVHENQRAGKTGGFSPSGQRYKKWAKVGEWKYLETPFKKRQGLMKERIQTRVDVHLQRFR